MRRSEAHQFEPSVPAEEPREYDRLIFSKRVDRLHKKIIKSHEDRPDPYDFGDIYQKDEIRIDAQRVAAKEKLIIENLEEKRAKNPKETENEQTNAKLSDSMEILVANFGEMYDWFGGDAYTARTTKYDDYFNGVDLVLQFGAEDDPIAFSIDVTSDSDISAIDKKIDSCAEKALSRDPEKRQVKYFESPVDQDHQAIYNVIPLVVGFENMTAMDLMEKAADMEDVRSKESKSDLDRRKIDALKNEITTHPAQMAMLKQMAIQLSYYAEAIPSRRGLPPDYLEKISAISDKLNGIIAEKIDQGIKIDENDLVLRRIENKLQNLYEKI